MNSTSRSSSDRSPVPGADGGKDSARGTPGGERSSRTPPTVPATVSASGCAGSALVACVGADPATFGPVYDALAPVAFGVSLAVVSNADRAAEVTQDVMMEVWQTAALYDPAQHASARTWVATIARRRAVDRVRAERSRGDPGLRDLSVDVGAVTNSYDAHDLGAEVEGEALRRQLDSLPPAQHEAIALVYCRGLTYREIAEHLAVEPMTVKTRIRDGLERLCGHRGSPRA